jgi:hypothetical protein
MSYIIGEKYSSISGDESYDIVKRLITRTYTIIYFIQCSATEGSSTIYDTPGLPQIGDQPIVNGVVQRSARCIKRALSELDTSNNIWSVECSFDSNYSPDDDTYPIWSWSFETQDVVIQYTPNYNLPICNTVAQPLVVTSPQPLPILTIERYEYNFDPTIILSYVSRVNSMPFWGAPPWSVLCTGINDEQALMNGVKLRKVQYVFKFKIDEWGWRLLLLNEGSKSHLLYTPHTPGQRDQSDVVRAAALHTVKDEVGNPTTCILDFDGYPLGAGPTSGAVEPDFVPVTSQMIPTIYNGGYLIFDQFPMVNFNTLSLGPWNIPRI